MFRTRPARTWLTILGIGVGISAVVLLVGLGFGLQQILLEKIVFGEALLSLNVTAPPSRVVVLDDAMVEELRGLEHVEDVSPMAGFSSLATFNNLTGNVFLQGVNEKYFSYAGIVAKYGRLFTDQETNKIVVSGATLKLFGIDDPAQGLGKKVSFTVFIPVAGSSETQEVPLSKHFEIIGVLDDQTSLAVYIPISVLRQAFAIPYYEKARVKVASNEFLNSVEDKILKKGFYVTSLSKTVDQANKIFKGIQIMLAFFGGIALIVSAIGMFNTMTVTLLERTKEIGIMRTIGGSPFNIKLMFLTESVLMGFLGGVIGIIIGIVIGFLVNYGLNVVAAHFGGTAVSLFRYPIPFLLFIAVFSGIMGFVTGLFPSRRAAKLNPLDAIRYS